MSQQMARFWCCERSVWQADGDAGGQMGDAHRAFGLVDVLAAGAGRAIDVDAHILFRNVDLDRLIDHRIDRDARKARVAARIGIERRNAHQPMHAGFGLEPAIGILALDQQAWRI
jgi:hypothetical protein